MCLAQVVSGRQVCGMVHGSMYLALGAWVLSVSDNKHLVLRPPFQQVLPVCCVLLRSI
jgi:hypothetical protein